MQRSARRNVQCTRRAAHRRVHTKLCNVSPVQTRPRRRAARYVRTVCEAIKRAPRLASHTMQPLQLALCAVRVARAQTDVLKADRPASKAAWSNVELRSNTFMLPTTDRPTEPPNDDYQKNDPQKHSTPIPEVDVGSDHLQPAPIAKEAIPANTRIINAVAIAAALGILQTAIRQMRVQSGLVVRAHGAVLMAYIVADQRRSEPPAPS